MKDIIPKFNDRELSWLSFNARVLQEASDITNSIQERIKFLGIYSNNQDEFFRVRVATLYRLIEFHKKKNSNKVYDVVSILNKVLQTVKEQQISFSRIFSQIKTEMAACNIFIINEDQLTQEQGEVVRKHFREKVRHHLFPIMLKSFKSADFLADQSIYLAISVGREGFPEKKSHAIMEVPTGAVDRFFVIPDSGDKKYIIVLDDVIRYCLDEIFSRFKYDQFSAFTFKFTRDAEMDIDSDVSKSFLEVMTQGLEQRKQGFALRFVYDRKMPEDLFKAVTQKLKISNHDRTIEGGRYHNFKDFMGFPYFEDLDTHAKKEKAVPHKDIQDGVSILKVIRRKDIMLHYPYQSFQYIVDLLREASIDSKVKSIKMTLYRVSNPSNVINALINAARNGKRVVVFLELQARFDEEANIYWSEVLQNAGVHVLTGIPGLKVHSKIILINRKENSGYKLYANVGTGNFHEKTGSLYCDDTLLTSDPRITSEIEKVFGLFQMSFRPSRFRHLAVSPFSTRNFFIRLLNTEIKNAKAGKEAWVIIKLNSLADISLIKKLYQASQAGVKVDLIIRGICKIVPGIKGLSDNINVISILDKYLEHSRVVVFCNGGEERYFISSADWMVRNLDNRIEVTTPIYDLEIQKEIKGMLLIQLADNTKSRIIDEAMSNTYYTNDEPKVRAQVEIPNFLRSIHSNKT